MKPKNRMSILMVGIVLALASVTLGINVSEIVATVDQVTYTHYLNDSLYTHTGDNRGLGGAQHDLARDNIQSFFVSFGLQTSLSPFTYNGATYNNVVGVLQGTDLTAGEYIIGAHYDSFTYTGAKPGADDNASGVAGILEAANVLSQYDFKSTLVFIAFDREEQEMIGSSAYASAHSGDDIRGMVSLDMIAYNDGGTNQARIYGHDSSDPLKESLADAVSAYGNGISAVINGTLDQSDHAPFENAGFQAALLIEYGVWDNHYFHSANDNVDMPNYIDYQYATNMTRATVGYLAESAVIVPEPATICLLTLGGLTLLRRKSA